MSSTSPEGQRQLLIDNNPTTGRAFCLNLSVIKHFPQIYYNPMNIVNVSAFIKHES